MAGQLPEVLQRDEEARIRRTVATNELEVEELMGQPVGSPVIGGMVKPLHCSELLGKVSILLISPVIATTRAIRLEHLVLDHYEIVVEVIDVDEVDAKDLFELLTI